MALIPAYTFTSYELQAKSLGLPLTLDEDGPLTYELDVITQAVEQGQIDRMTWVKQCFVDEDSFKLFIDKLAEYDECFRINDRCYAALMRIADVYDEEGFIATQDIADQLYGQAAETGQVE